MNNNKFNTLRKWDFEAVIFIIIIIIFAIIDNGINLI